jgi:hypothetical protein
MAVPWEALLLYDVVIFVALLYKSFQKRRETSMLWRNNSIINLLIRDGAFIWIINLGGADLSSRCHLFRVSLPRLCNLLSLTFRLISCMFFANLANILTYYVRSPTMS